MLLWVMCTSSHMQRHATKWFCMHKILCMKNYDLSIPAFVAFSLIWSFISSSHGSIPSMTRHAQYWYWQRLLILCTCKKFVFFDVASSLLKFFLFSLNSNNLVQKFLKCYFLCNSLRWVWGWYCYWCWRGWVAYFSCFLCSSCHSVCLVNQKKHTGCAIGCCIEDSIDLMDISYLILKRSAEISSFR